MTLEARQRIHSEILAAPNKILFYTPTGATYVKQLTIRDRIVRVDNATYAGTLVLPSVSEAKGLTFQISVTSAAQDCVITDAPALSLSDGIDWADITATDAEDQLTLLSTGRTWTIVEDEAT
jgi:hypothetical protein